jgi:hypothetical protein
MIACDRGTLALVLLLPLIQLLLFAYAIHMDVKHIPLVVADQSKDSASRAYLDDMFNSGYFDTVYSASGQAGAVAVIDSGQARVGIVIPPNFAADVDRGGASVLFLVDGSDPFTTQSAYNTANLIAQAHTVVPDAQGYRSAIVETLGAAEVEVTSIDWIAQHSRMYSFRRDQPRGRDPSVAENTLSQDAITIFISK